MTVTHEPWNDAAQPVLPSVEGRPQCGCCSRPMRRGRRRALRLSTVIPLALGLVALVVAWQPHEDLRAVAESVLNIPEDAFDDRPEASETADRLVERGATALAIGGVGLFLVGVALAATPKRIWVCESCNLVLPRHK